MNSNSFNSNPINPVNTDMERGGVNTDRVVSNHITNPLFVTTTDMTEVVNMREVRGKAMNIGLTIQSAHDIGSNNGKISAKIRSRTSSHAMT